ncbi:MAG: response regulator [Candidatus Cloacimonadales bacterium]|nr:response regulator [Candidatus Cloacimonadales bacterium]
MSTREVEILLVEDNSSDAKLTIRALKKYNLGNKINHVDDGEKALDFIYSRKEYANRDIENIPKVILLDLKLPKVDGLEVLKILKNDERTKTIPVVVLTSSTQETDLLKSYKLGANSYVVKPVDFEQFIKAVSELGLYWLLLNKSPK